MDADDDLARFIKSIVADPDRMVRVFKERPGYRVPFRRGVDRTAEFLRLDGQKKSERDIALALHVTTRTVMRLRGANDRLKRKPPERRPDSDRAFARRLLDDGCSITETARSVGVPFKTITRWFPDAEGMSAADGHRVAVAMKNHRKAAGLPTLRSA